MGFLSIFSSHRKLTFNKVIIAVFLLIYVGLYFDEYLTLIKLSYALLMVGAIYSIYNSRKLRYLDFIIVTISFLIFGFSSLIWAVNPTSVVNSSILLFKSSFIAIAFVQLIKDESDIKFALFWLFISGIIFSIIYLGNINLVDLGGERITTTGEDDLENINVVAMLVSFSFVYFFYEYFTTKKIVNLFCSLVSLFVTILLGSRKSILVILLSIIFIFFKSSLKLKAKVVLFCLAAVLLITNLLPHDYLQFVSERLLGLGFWSEYSDSVDVADQIRKDLIRNGVSYFLHRPLFGHGLYNFSIVNGQNTGIFLYSHNNFIELLVGCGLIGFMIYYAIYILIYRNFKKSSNLTAKYFVYLILFMLLFNHIAIVVILDRFVWILLALLYAYSYISKNEYH